ncbi:MAG: DNA repair protein RadC [Polyangiales bacterium]
MDRPRERLASLGPQALGDAELLSLLLGAGDRGLGVEEVARALLDASGGLRQLAAMTTTELRRLDGLGPAKAARLAAALEVGTRAHMPSPASTPLEDSRAVFVRYGRPIANSRVERFWVVSVDAKNRVKGAREVARGGRISCQVDPAEVFRHLVIDSASGALFLHNHPSGDTEPSPDDLALTARLVEAGAVLEIRILDHLIVGAGRYTSLRDAGLWPTLPAKSGTSVGSDP